MGAVFASQPRRGCSNTCVRGSAAVWQDCYKPHRHVEATLMGLLVVLKLPPTLLEAKVRLAQHAESTQTVL